MLSASPLKHDVDFNKNLGGLMEIMKLAAVSRFNQFRLYQKPAVDFLKNLEGILGYIYPLAPEHIFFRPAARVGASAVVLVSADEGFLGELNVLLVNKLTGLRKDNDEIIVLGNQGAQYLKELRIEFKQFNSISDKLELGQMEELRDYIFELYLKQKVSRIWFIYPQFVNMSLQQTELEELLPLSLAIFSKLTKVSGELLLEPGFDPAVSGWVKLWLLGRIYQIFWSAKLAEFSARIMHLEGSVQELGRINQRLRLEYFKYLHGLSDKTIREVSAARMLRR